jgi:hypothetical protein
MNIFVSVAEPRLAPRLLTIRRLRLLSEDGKVFSPYFFTYSEENLRFVCKGQTDDCSRIEVSKTCGLEYAVQRNTFFDEHDWNVLTDRI